MAIEKPLGSPASINSDDYHFSSLSQLERQTLLDQDDTTYDLTPPPSPTIAAPRSTAFLDGVRGVAALLVYLHHFAPSFYFEEHHHGFGQTDPKTGESWHHFAGLPFIRLFYTGGDAAVALFFVLSGYVLTISPLTKIVHMVREGGGSREGWNATVKSILSAVVRRPIRLYLPALMFAFTYAILRHTPFGPLSTFPDLQPVVTAELALCFQSFLKFFNPFQQHGINREWFPYGVVVWTIPIELKGSMLVFLLTALYAFASQSRFYRRLYFLQLITLSLMLLLVCQWTMSLFVAGMVLALCDIYGLGLTSLPVLSKSSAFKSSSNIINHICLTIGLYLLSQPSHKSSIDYSLRTPGWTFLTSLIPKSYLTASGSVEWFDPEYFRFWTSIGGVLTLYALLRITWTQRLFAAKIPMYLGRISFALYLTHVTVTVITMPFFLRLVGQWYDGTPMGERWYDNKLYLPEWGFMGFNIRYLGSLVLQLPVSLAVAHVITVAYDQPALRLAHKVAQILRLSSPRGEKKMIPKKEDNVVLGGREVFEEKTRDRRLA